MVSVMHIDSKENICVNVLEESGAKYKYILETPTKCMMVKGAGYERLHNAQMKILIALCVELPNSGLGCTIEYSKTLKTPIGNLCTVKFYDNDVYMEGTMKLRIVDIQTVDDADVCFPYQCHH